MPAAIRISSKQFRMAMAARAVPAASEPGRDIKNPLKKAERMKKIFCSFLAVCTAGLLLPALTVAQTKWLRSGHNPVLSAGEEGAWDSKNVYTPCVVHAGSTYHMWYAGSDGTQKRIGHATSTDGIAWTRHPDPVLEAGPEGAWDMRTVSAPTVVFDNATFTMWYYGDDGTAAGIGCATSTDGITWTKHGANPVLTAGALSEDFDHYSVEYPCVVRAGGAYKMWYTGFSQGSGVFKVLGGIGSAESDDGITWTKSPQNPVLVHGSRPLAWDNVDVYRPAVVFDGETYHLWFAGSGFLNFSPVIGISFYSIGYARSSDGISWEQYRFNPVLRRSFGMFTSWDGRWVDDPAVISEAGRFKMWYAGTGGWGANEHTQIGYAESPLLSE